MNIARQVEYWRSGAEEDFEVAKNLLQNNYIRQGLFFGHLALEKMLKAHVNHTLQDVPPQIHNLVRLAEIARIPLNESRKNFLEAFNSYNLRGRYPGSHEENPSSEEMQEIMVNLKEGMSWLRNQF